LQHTPHGAVGAVCDIVAREDIQPGEDRV